MYYFPHIDGLRAVAVLSVIFFHFGISPFQGGFVGVDIFFVISGFLISSLIHRELSDTGEFRFARFYIRRVRRLLPSLLATIFVTSLFTATFFTSQQLESYGAEVISSLLSLSNFYFWAQSGYFDTAAENKALLHMWSLSVEEQFYLIWPISFVAAYKLMPPKLFLFALYLLFLLSLTLTVVLTDYELGWLPKQSQALFYLTPFRVYEFLLGVIGVFLVQRVPRYWYIQEVLFLLGLAGVVCSVALFSQKTIFPYYTALLPCFSALLIILSGYSRISKILLANKISVYIGLISYTLYLVHWPVLVLAKQLKFDGLYAVNIWLILGIIFVTSLCIYYAVEKPLRATTSTIHSTGILQENALFLKGCSVAAVIIAVLGCVLVATSGLQSLKQEVYSSDFVAVGKSKRYSLINASCRIENTQDRACDLERPIQILIYGNSHEPDGYNIMHQITKNNDNVNLILFGSNNFCEIKVSKIDGISSIVKRNNCLERVAALNDENLINALDIVVFSSNRPFAPNKETSWKLLENLKSRNASLELVVLGSYFNTDKECAQISNRHGNPDACKLPDYLTYNGFSERDEIFDVELVNSMEYLYLNKYDALCEKNDLTHKSCLTSADGEPMFYDQHHLSLGFALHLGELFSRVYSSELEELGLKKVEKFSK